MKKFRVRSTYNGDKTPWVYMQKYTKQENTPKPKQEVQLFSAQSKIHAKRSKTNQYGRFKYNEFQYGKLQVLLGTNIEISKTPIRIKTNNGEFIYLQQATIDGACPAIRIRSKYETEKGPWVYLHHEEV